MISGTFSLTDLSQYETIIPKHFGGFILIPPTLTFRRQTVKCWALRSRTVPDVYGRKDLPPTRTAQCRLETLLLLRSLDLAEQAARLGKPWAIVATTRPQDVGPFTLPEAQAFRRRTGAVIRHANSLFRQKAQPLLVCTLPTIWEATQLGSGHR